MAKNPLKHLKKMEDAWLWRGKQFAFEEGRDTVAICIVGVGIPKKEQKELRQLMPHIKEELLAHGYKTVKF